MFPSRKFPRRTVSQRVIFPEGFFPEGQFPRRTVSQSDAFPEGQFPRRKFPRRQVPRVDFFLLGKHPSGKLSSTSGTSGIYSLCRKKIRNFLCGKFAIFLWKIRKRVVTNTRLTSSTLICEHNFIDLTAIFLYSQMFKFPIL